MNENSVPVTNDASFITSVSQSSNMNDVIDLTEINDSEGCGVTSSCSVIVSNNSVSLQQPGNRLPRNRRRKITGSSEDNPVLKVQPESKDDSICILYEKIQPPPDIEVVNEVIIDRGIENANNVFLSNSVPPIIMGTCTESPVNEFQHLPPLLPTVSSEWTGSFSQPIDYRINLNANNVLQQAPEYSTRPSCKYATVNERAHPPPISVVAPHPVAAQRLSQSTSKIPLGLQRFPDNLPSLVSDLKNSNTEVKVPKIQCSICLDGPDEIAASNRNFTSTKCGHVFCDVCIKTALKNAAKCPTCRKKVTSKQIHPLFF